MIARWLFLILVVVNLFVFLWAYSRPVPFQRGPEPLPAGVPEIRLLDESTLAKPEEKSIPDAKHVDEAADEISAEIDSVEPTESDGEEKPPLEQETANRCIKLGPFSDEVQAFDLISLLSEAGHQADIDETVNRRESGFWVLIPAKKTASGALLDGLRKAGISDVWRFAKGDLEGAISLGLYSDRASAAERIEQLADKGFNATVAPRELEEAVYWVNSTYSSDDEKAKTALEQAYNKYPHFNFPPPACDDVARSGTFP